MAQYPRVLLIETRNVFTETKLIFSSIFTAVGDSKRIQLENMLGVYLVLAAGGCFSVILVLVEMWWRKHGTNVMAALRTKYPFMRQVIVNNITTREKETLNDQM